MNLSYLSTTLITIFLFVTFFPINHNSESHKFYNHMIQEKEIGFSNLRQLTFSGENVEAYFSSDGEKLIFQSHDEGSLCDLIYIMNIETGSTNMVSTGEGMTTCSCFVYPDCQKRIYTSTHLGNKNFQKNQTIVWAMFGIFILTMMFF